MLGFIFKRQAKQTYHNSRRWRRCLGLGANLALTYKLHCQPPSTLYWVEYCPSESTWVYIYLMIYNYCITPRFLNKTLAKPLITTPYMGCACKLFKLGLLRWKYSISMCRRSIYATYAAICKPIHKPSSNATLHVLHVEFCQLTIVIPTDVILVSLSMQANTF